MPSRALLVLLPALLLPLAGPPRLARADAGWQWPLPAPRHVVRGFDPPAHEWLPGHRGVDLAATAGADVVTAGDGLVSFAGRIAGVGVVTVRHPGGLETTYEPVRTAVRVGQILQAGAVLGRLVVRGSHCAPAACLHWGLRRGIDYLDPLSLVGAGRVRLLPLLTGERGLPASAGVTAVGSSAVTVSWALARWRRRRGPPA